MEGVLKRMVKFMSPSDEVRSEPTEGDKLEEVDLGLGTREARKQPYVLQEDVARDECEDEFTVEQAVEAIGFGQFQITLSLLTGFCWMADAMEMMILSIIGPELKCAWQLSLIQEASITTVVFLGMFASSTFWGKICDKFGRRTGLILTSLVVFYFGVLSGFAPNYAWLLIIRFLVGFGIGGAPQSYVPFSLNLNLVYFFLLHFTNLMHSVVIIIFVTVKQMHYLSTSIHDKCVLVPSKCVN